MHDMNTFDNRGIYDPWVRITLTGTENATFLETDSSPAVCTALISK